jgi:hypothetical protein
MIGGNFKSAVDDLNAAVLNDPKDSTTWFLRGICHRSLKADSKEASRDFFRAALIESKEKDARKTRVGQIERIQGGVRNIADDAIIDYGSQLNSRELLEYELGIGTCLE